MADETELDPTELRTFAKNFLVKRKPPVLEVFEGPNGTVVARAAGAVSGTTTIRPTSTETETSTTSGTSTKAAVRMSSLPRALAKRVSTLAPVADTDNDNSTDSDSGSDLISDSDAAEAGRIDYADRAIIRPPLAPEGTFAVIKLK